MVKSVSNFEGGWSGGFSCLQKIVYKTTAVRLNLVGFGSLADYQVLCSNHLAATVPYLMHYDILSWGGGGGGGGESQGLSTSVANPGVADSEHFSLQ